MSEEDRNPKSVTEALENYLAGSKPGRVRSLEDDLPSELITRAFMPERATPRPEAPPKAIPPGYVKHPGAARYEELRASKDFEDVRRRMLQTLDPYTVREVDGDYDAFDLHFTATRQQMQEEAAEAAARAKEVRERERAERERERKILANVDTGNFKTLDEAARIAERYMK